MQLARNAATYAGYGGDFEINYAMLPAQREFHFDRSPFLFYTGGYGAGKTYALCMKMLDLSIENAPIRCGIIVPSVPMMRRDVVPLLETEILDQNNIPFKLSKQEHLYYFPQWDGYLQVVSADQPDSIKGPSWAAAGYNEPGIMNKKAYLVGISRVRHPRARKLQNILAGTPEGLNWLYEEFVVGPADPIRRKMWLKTHKVVKASTYENIYLPKEYLTNLETAYDSKMARAYMHGEFLLTDGMRVYYNYEPAIHCRNDVKLNSDLPICWCWDFNINPFSTVLAQVKDGNVFVFDEIVVESANTYAVLKEFERRGYHKHKDKIRIYGDAEAWQRTSISDYDIIREQLIKWGFDEFHREIKVPKANPPVRSRLNTVNGFLKNSLGKVRMFISPRCRELLTDFIKVIHDKNGGINKTADLKRTHTSDALGYFLHKEFPPPSRGKVIFMDWK